MADKYQQRLTGSRSVARYTVADIGQNVQSASE